MTDKIEQDAAAPPVASEAIAWETWSQGEKYGSRFRHLTRAAVGDKPYHVGVAIEELPPGKQSCPFHFHMLEEEHILVLEGECTLRLGEERLRFKAGDYAVFPAGAKVGHCLVNEGDKTCRYVVIGEDNPNESCVYPDSNKVSNRWLGERYDRAAQKDYWDGEE
ncbi:MAG: cupin domain-containing protein [Hyphomonadaceae bacterium]|nr:cupin domain-containing protein [Hyphomonadaceae bacterium]